MCLPCRSVLQSQPPMRLTSRRVLGRYLSQPKHGLYVQLPPHLTPPCVLSKIIPLETSYLVHGNSYVHIGSSSKYPELSLSLLNAFFARHTEFLEPFHFSFGQSAPGLRAQRARRLLLGSFFLGRSLFLFPRRILCNQRASIFHVIFTHSHSLELHSLLWILL